VASEDPIDPTGVLAELTKAVTSANQMNIVLDEVLQLIKRRIPGTDETSITLIRNEKAYTVASSGSLATALDEIQYAAGYGPCLTAARTDELHTIDDTATESRWPDFVVHAREQGLGSSVSLPMPVESYLVGALNIYSLTPHAFDADSVVLAQALAAHVTVALGHAESDWGMLEKNQNLQLALQSRGVIDQAKGIIMATSKCTAADAFQQLRNVSMSQNIKLADIAASLVASASGHPVRLETPPSDDNQP